MPRRPGTAHLAVSTVSATGLLGLLALVLWAAPCAALISFEPGAVLNGNATSDNSPTGNGFPLNDGRPIVAGDGAGNWLTAWWSVDPLGGPFDSYVFVARSSDDGSTWSSPTIAEDVGFQTLITDGAGVWVLIGGSRSSRSLDFGVSWTHSAPLGVIVNDTATDRAGTWVGVAASDDSLGGTIGTDNDVFFVRSTDNALTWSAPMVLNDDAATDGASDFAPRIATDGAGTWVVVWRRGSGTTMAATSTDNGQTWSSPVFLSSGMVGDQSSQPDVVSDGVGAWVVVWVLGGSTPVGVVVSSSSVDDGASWSAPVTVSPTDVGDEARSIVPRIESDGQGTVYTVWEFHDDTFGGQLGKDSDALMSRSIDGGATWSPSSALEPNMTTDSGRDLKPRFGYDGAGTWVAVWNSDEPGDGSLGDDFDIFSAVSRDDCSVTPVEGCLASTVTRKSAFKIKDGKGGRDKALFKWARGQETLLADLGDPTTTSDYLLCGYDAVSAVPRLILEKDIPAGRTCKAQPCWELKNGKYRYRDPKREHGAVKSVLLKPDVEGRAKLKVSAGGALVGLPAMPLAQTPDVQVQLHNLETGVCWEATFSTNVRNDSEQFKAKSD